MKVNIIYWSASGNTEQMAKLILEGAEGSGHQGEIIDVSAATTESVSSADVVFLGSPAMGAEVIEEDSMEPFVESIKELVSGKKVGLFGSYDWGDGEWMVDWVERMNSYGAEVLGDGCIAHLYPEGDDEAKCIEYGKSI